MSAIDHLNPMLGALGRNSQLAANHAHDPINVAGIGAKANRIATQAGGARPQYKGDPGQHVSLPAVGATPSDRRRGNNPSRNALGFRNSTNESQTEATSHGQRQIQSLRNSRNDKQF